MLPICRSVGSLALCATMAMGSTLPAFAQAQTLTIGSPNVAVADPLVPRPPGTPCAVNLLTNQEFADFNSKPFSFTPPANCPGPWQKVVLAADFNVTVGRQFDRTAQIWLGGAIIYLGTTQEPSATVAPSWHIERDLTDYSALFATAQSGHADLGNFVGTSGGVDYTGIIYGNATLYFYPLAEHSPPPRPDVLLPLSTNPANGSTSLVTPTDQLSIPFSALPTNIERAFLDVYAQSQNADEFWFFDLPNDLAPIFQDTGSTAFKEALVTIDGQPAGIAPIYPWIYTGGADPLLWRPVPGVQTLAFEPYRVDLTPFVGVLNDSGTHTIAISVYNAANYFSVAANLMLYLDERSKQVTGRVTKNTLNATPTVDVQNDVDVVSSDPNNPNASGSVSVTSNRNFTVAGTARTSHGTVTTRIDTRIAFSSVQQLAVDSTQYKQDTVQNTTIDATTTRSQGLLATVVREQRSYPLTFDYEDVTAADGTETLYTFVDQEFSQKIGAGLWLPLVAAQRDNHVVNTVTRHYDASGVLVSAPAQASQSYTYNEPLGACYSRQIAAQNGSLSSVADGKGCWGKRNNLSWRDLFAQYASILSGATVKLLP